MFPILFLKSIYDVNDFFLLPALCIEQETYS